MRVKRIMLWILLVMCTQSQKIYAQPKDDLITDAQKKRVLKAKKFLNNYRIEDGEKILFKLVKENPNHVYFREAWLTVQRQILTLIKEAEGEIKEIEEELKMESDTTSVKDSMYSFQKENNILEEIDEAQVDSTDEDIELTKKELKKKRKRKKRPLEIVDIPLTEAVVSIDSSIFKDDEQEDNIDSLSLQSVANQFTKPKDKLRFLRSVVVMPYTAYKNQLINNCRESTRRIEYSDSASRYLREFLVDTLQIDTALHEETYDMFYDACEELFYENYSKAMPLLKQCVETDTAFFKGHLYLGDVYTALQMDTLANKEFMICKKLQPTRPESYERIAKLYFERGKYTKAAASIIEAIMIYPQRDYISFLKKIVNKSGHDFNTQWLQREVFPISTNNKFEDIVVTKKSPWFEYQAAKQDVYSYADSSGILRSNEITRERYLEVYAWQKMLNSSYLGMFPFARAMQKIGYLDCYVLITLFHQDLYGQFADIVTRRPEKVKKYFYILLNWDEKRFDKIRQN